MTATKPPAGLDGDNDFHELWWDDTYGNPIPDGKREIQLHEVWQWMGDAPNPGWAVPGEAVQTTAERAWEDGWRYVRPIRLCDDRARRAGEPPDPLLDGLMP